MARVGKAMMIGGKRFTVVGMRNTKREADQWAKKLRDGGNLARVSKFAEGYYVWKGPRRSMSRR